MVDYLKRDFDRELGKVGGAALPYWFCADINEEGRLHIHGAFLPVKSSPAELIKIRKAMKDAWGEWKAPGKHFQCKFNPKRCDDGWATYCMRNQRAVAKIIGPRTFTITNGLRREAEETYSTLCRIMRSGDVSQN